MPASIVAPARFTLWPKRVAYAVYVCVAFVLGVRWGLERRVLLIVIAGPLMAAELLLRPLVAARLKAFDRQLMAALQAGKVETLLPLYRSQRLLRFACANHELLPKLGLIHRKLGNDQRAIAAFSTALEDAPRTTAPLLSRNLADAYYAASDFEKAESYYRASQDEQHVNAGVRARIARLTLQRCGDPEEAELFMRQAVEAARGQASGGRFRCQLVLMLLERGKLEDALWHLALAEEELQGSEGPDREALDLARRAVKAAAAGDALAPPSEPDGHDPDDDRVADNDAAETMPAGDAGDDDAGAEVAPADRAPASD